MDAGSTRPLAHVSLLGTPQLVLPDGDVHPLERKDAALLALLALEGSMARARVAALLWPDADGEAARANLRQRLHRLRKRVGADLVSAHGDVLCLADALTHDLAAGPAAAGPRSARATPAPAARDQAADEAPAALIVASAELLAACDYGDCEALAAWLDAARNKRRSARRDTLAAAAARLERAGQIAPALQHAERLLADGPLLEHAHRRVMRLHYLRGDRAAALAAYARCCDVLRRELGTTPGAETRELAALIESSGALPGPAAPLPVTVLRPPVLVGRMSEWRTLESAWRARQVVFVGGEPGIGKSRLLADFTAAQGGILVGARPGDAQVPYALLARLLRALLAGGSVPHAAWARRELARLVPEFDPGWTAVGDVNAARLAQAVVQLLAPGQREAKGLALDDLQFADPASVHVLGAVLRGEAPALPWLLGARGHELPAALRATLLPSGGAALAQVVLLPLDAAATAALLHSLALRDFDAQRWAAPIYRHTGGNPMFVLETLATLAGDAAARAQPPERLPLPASVGQLIETRLHQLSAAALKLARLAAVADKDFDLALAAAVLCVHPLDLADPWSELEAAQIVAREGFVHDLIFEATRRSVPAALVPLLHRDIAAVLQARGAAPERIARHWRAARAWALAARAYANAAQVAHDHSRRAEELALLRQAAECCERAGADGPMLASGAGADAHAAPGAARSVLAAAGGVVSKDAAAEAAVHGCAMRFDIELRSAHASLLIDRADEARRYAHSALALAATEQERVAALAACAESEEFLGELTPAMEHAAAGLQLATEMDATPDILTHAALLGRSYAARGDMARGCALFDAHAARVAAAGTAPAARAFLLHQAVVLDQTGRRAEAVNAGLRALRLAEKAGDASRACLCHIHVASFYARLGNGAAAFEHLERAVPLREKIGRTGGQTDVADLYLGVMCNELGRFGQTLDLLAAANERLARGNAVSWAVMAQGVLARTWVALGQPARGWQLIAADVSGVTDAVRGLRLLNQARVLRALGRPRARRIEQARELFERHAQHEGDLLVTLEQALEADPHTGAQLAREVHAHACERQHGPLQLDALVVGCAALLAAGEPRAAAAKARAALQLAQRSINWAVYRAETWWRAYEALAAARAETESLAALSQAVEWINATLPHVPDELKDSFLNRNPTNRAILATAHRKLRPV
jgi:DNA-binding SARP family transcriptional activator